MRRTAKSTRRLEGIARKLNERGLGLLRFAQRSPFRWVTRGSDGAIQLSEAGSAGAESGRRGPSNS